SAIEDLSPLKGMKLNYLNIKGTNVTDISPLKGMQLEYLDYDKEKIKDVSFVDELIKKEESCDADNVDLW
ncbi:MAG: hypothetical protein ACYTFY_15465, partial [Planctomycetota bacterium]